MDQYAAAHTEPPNGRHYLLMICLGAASCAIALIIMVIVITSGHPSEFLDAILSYFDNSDPFGTPGEFRPANTGFDS